jgi:hypothetical protein
MPRSRVRPTTPSSGANWRKFADTPRLHLASMSEATAVGAITVVRQRVAFAGSFGDGHLRRHAPGLMRRDVYVGTTGVNPAAVGAMIEVGVDHVPAGKGLAHHGGMDIRDRPEYPRPEGVLACT